MEKTKIDRTKTRRKALVKMNIKEKKEFYYTTLIIWFIVAILSMLANTNLLLIFVGLSGILHYLVFKK